MSYAVDTPAGRVTACGKCKIKPATRFLQALKKRHHYCDTCEPTDAKARPRLVRYDAPVPCPTGVLYAAPINPPAGVALPEPEVQTFSLAPRPGIDFGVLARLSALEAKVNGQASGTAPTAEQAALAELLEELDAETIVDGIRLARETQEIIRNHRRELEAARGERDEAERRFAEGARAYRSLQDRNNELVVAHRELGESFKKEVAGREAEGRRFRQERAEHEATVDQLRRVSRDLASAKDQINKLTADLAAAESVANDALNALPAPPAPAPIDEVVRALTGPTVEAPEVVVVRETPVAVADPTLREVFDAAREPAIPAPKIRVRAKAEKAYRGLASHDAAKVRHAVSLWMTGQARVGHLTAALRRVPRFAKGRDLYGVHAGNLYIICERDGAEYVVVDFVPAHELR